MERTYREETLPISALVGLRVSAVLISEDNDRMILKTNKGNVYLTWEGSCCAQCFIANLNGVDNLVGATILEAEDTEWKNVDTDEDWDVLETMGTKLKTTKGYVDIETRVSHNGYYGGMVNISTKGFVDQYNCLIDLKLVGTLSTAKDF